MTKKKNHIFLGLANIFLAILVLFSVVAGVANVWSGRVNELLGTEKASIERSLDPEDYRHPSDFSTPADLIAAEIAYGTRLQVEGTVALKGTPAINGTKVTLFGMRSGENMQFGGSMGELISATNVVTLSDALSDRGFSVNPDMVQFYKEKAAAYAPTKTPGGNVVSSYDSQGAAVGEVPASEYDAAKIGDYTDAAIIVLGRDAGESACFYPGENGLANPAEFSQSPTGNIFSLTNEERDLVNWVKDQGFGKVIVLLNSGTSMEIEELKQDAGIDSILWIGNPGAYGTYGIADLLKGAVLPSGHLPDTFAVNSALSPAAKNFGIYVFDNIADIETTTNNALRSDWYLVELEGIYTGYKYYETRYYDTVTKQGNASQANAGESTTGKTWAYENEVSYPFGFGLEGSTFAEEITDVNIDWSGEGQSSVTVKVTNTGDTAAKHAVQLYVSLPYTDYDRANGVEKSAIQLIGYAKTGEAQEASFRDVVLLAPAESEDVTVTFNAQDLYTYDRTYEHDGVKGAWTLEAGDYWFATGNGAHEAVNAVLAGMGFSAEAETDARKETVDDERTITESNDTIVQNELDDADLNSWGVEVQYLTRNDWLNTFPKSVDSLSATEDMIVYLRNVFYDASAEKDSYDGPESFSYGADNGVKAIQLMGLDFDDPLYDQVLDELTLQDFINQYIAYLGDLDSIAMPMEGRADSPLGIIGTVGQRTKGTIYEVTEDTEGYKHYTNVYSGGPTLAATFSPLLQREYGTLVGNDCIWTGYHTWFGPGMNLHRTPYNGRNIAYYSEDSVLTGNTGAYVHQTLNKYGVVTNVKHFAFNDQETNRDGLAVFLNEQAARENELRGFQIGIRDGGIKGLMSAFNRIGVIHVGAHRGLMNGILRGEWGWKTGFMMTDSVKSAQYFLPRECIMASNDTMLGGSNNGKVWNLSASEVEKDIVLQSKLRESYHRKLFNYVNSFIMDGIDAESAAGGGQVWWVTMLQVIIGMSALCFVTFTALYLLVGRKRKGVAANG